MKQLSFLPRAPRFHGGEHSVGKRKRQRPLDPKKPIHVVMRASKAQGSKSMLSRRHERWVNARTREVAVKWGLKLYRYSNVGNHLHLLVITPSRLAFQNFLRELAGSIARSIQGKGKFWDLLAFSRVVEWGRDLRNLETYFVKNLFEAIGVLTPFMKRAGVTAIPWFALTLPKI